MTCSSFNRHSSSCCRSSEGKRAVIGNRLFAAVQLLANLLRQLRVEEVTVLPLVRLAAETFTISSLDLLQVAATGKEAASSISKLHPSREDQVIQKRDLSFVDKVSNLPDRSSYGDSAANICQ